MPSLWRVAHRDRVTLGRRTNERRRRNPSTPNVRQSLRHGRGILCPHARSHRIGTGKCAGWRHHDAWNQKSKIRCNKAGGTLPPGQRLLVLVEAASLATTSARSKARGGGGLGAAEMTAQARSAKPLINESRYTYIVELAVPDTGLEIELNRQIVSFHRSRRIQPRYGRRFTRNNQMYSRWCFSDLATARAFLEQFGGELLHQ